MSAVPRESTDLESAPLLVNEDASSPAAPARKSFLQTLTDPQRELSVVEKTLVCVAFIFLILAATFIGLFAAERSKNNNQPPHVPEPPTWTHSSVVWTTTTTERSPAPTHTPAPPAPQPSVCLTPACVQLSAAILSSLDTTVDPCEDFYSYSSGGWQKAHPLPSDKGRWGSFNELAKANQQIVLDILKAPLPESSSSEAELDNLKKLHAEFNSCMNETRLNQLGEGALAPLLEDVKRLFPVDGYPTPRQTAGSVGDVGLGSDDVASAQSVVERIKAALAHAKQVARGRTVDAGSQVLSERPTEDDVEELKGPHGGQYSKELTDTLAYLHSIGVDALFDFVLEGDAAVNPQRQILWLYQSGLGLPSKEYYEEESITSVYESVLAGILEAVYTTIQISGGETTFVASAEDDQVLEDLWDWPWTPKPAPEKDHKPKKVSPRKLAAQVAKDVLRFETRLAKSQAPPEKLSNPTYSYNPFHFRKLRKMLPFNLASYVSSFAPRNFPEKIIVTSPSYVKAMTKIVEQEEDYVLQSYFLVRTALAFANNLGSDVQIRKSADKLKSLLTGVKEGFVPDRSEVCVVHTRNVLGHLTGAEFAQRTFGGDSKQQAEAIIVGIIEAFKSILGGLSWMDAESSTNAVRKADAITPKIGYPLYPNTTDPASLRAYYARLDIKEDDFLGNAVAANKLDAMRDWQSGLGNLRNRDSWEMSADEVNAYESPADNEIVFPAGILQSPFFSAEWPAYLNYGAFGAVAAHELCHAFDNSGSQYDYEGRFRAWWSNATVSAFQERAQCIAKQYSKFYVVGPSGEKVHVQGNLTNGEDIGDSGLRVAWKAWKEAVKDKGEEDKLPGLSEFSDEQLFFLAFGRIWANNVSPASAKTGVLTDPHSPNKFRVEGTLRNFEKFAEVWQCKKGSRFNPEKRCALW